jgi:threonine/homoserine/homoserine lactone efflux protein
VGEFVADSPLALTVITVVGGGYLIWLGVATLRRLSTPTGSADSHAGSDGGSRPKGSAGARSNRGTVVEGIGVSGLNAKGLLIFVALLLSVHSAANLAPDHPNAFGWGLVFT